MTIDYNNFAKTFSNSRKNMKWEEINYFTSFLEGNNNIKILDIGCGNGRFLTNLNDNEINYGDYLGLDLSQDLLDEAYLLHPSARFLHLNMLDLDKINDKFNCIFLIASFHHLNNLKDREDVLHKIYNLLERGGTIYMTNWSLNSELNKKRYREAIIKDSKNDFGSLDYNIKIGDFNRYYHCFDLKELEYLFKKTGFEIIENREFENKRNFISIIKKIGD